MIRVIDRTNRNQFIRTLEQHFRLRHEIFVKERGWKEFDRDGIYEMDQYDDENATYLISVDEHDEGGVGTAWPLKMGSISLALE